MSALVSQTGSWGGLAVGVDITPLQVVSPGGIGTSVYETLKALARVSDLELVLYGTHPPLVPFEGRPLDLDLPLRLGTGPLARSNIAWLRRGVGRLLAADGIDVFWGTRHVTPRVVGCATVTTIYDFWHERFPEQQPFVNRTLNRHVVNSSGREATLLTAISQATAEDAVRFLGISRDRVRPVLLGVDTGVFRPTGEEERASVLSRLGVTAPFVLLMDAFNPRKGARYALDAIAAEPSLSNVSVVALGRPRSTAIEFDVPAHAKAMGMAHRLVLPGDVGAEDLRALYSACLAFVYPSVYEGFGMPVLEAMACGAAVVAAEASSLPEVVGDAGILVGPSDAAAIGLALRRLAADRADHDRLARLGRERALRFTWDKTAEGMVAAFRDAVESKSREGR